MGKGKSKSKQKDQQAMAPGNGATIQGRQRWQRWGNLALGAAAATSTILYVWRRMQAGQQAQAEDTNPVTENPLSAGPVATGGPVDRAQTPSLSA
jgi:hypothetical protein